MKNSHLTLAIASTRIRRDAENSCRFLDMQSDVFEVGQMAAATALLLNVYMAEKESYAGRPEATAEGLVEHIEQWSDAVDFMVNHLSQMAQALREHYTRE